MCAGWDYLRKTRSGCLAGHALIFCRVDVKVTYNMNYSTFAQLRLSKSSDNLCVLNQITVQYLMLCTIFTERRRKGLLGCLA